MGLLLSPVDFIIRLTEKNVARLKRDPFEVEKRLKVRAPPQRKSAEVLFGAACGVRGRRDTKRGILLKKSRFMESLALKPKKKMLDEKDNQLQGMPLNWLLLWYRIHAPSRTDLFICLFIESYSVSALRL